MIRKLNYTGRKKIEHGNIQILLEAEDQKTSFDLQLNLDDMALPKKAKVYVEPYYKTSYMRFDFGTVDEIKRPHNTELNEILNSNNVLFKVKVVDESGTHGRLLALANHVSPISTDEDQINKKSILWVNYGKDLGQQLWKVSFLNEMPTLEVNNNIDMAKELIENDKVFFALVFPAAVKEIVNKIIIDKVNDELDEDEWQSLWLVFIRDVLGIGLIDLNEEKDAERVIYWVDDVVSAFCNRHRTLDRYNNQLAK